MPHVIRIGYRRLPDGRADPVCDPAIDPYLLLLWRHAYGARLETSEFVATGWADGRVEIRGRIRPNGLVRYLSQMARDALLIMKTVRTSVDGYPFEKVAEIVVSRAKPQILLCLGTLSVESEPPLFEDNGKIEIEPPRVEFDDGKLRVIVTGMAENHPMRAWADGLIRTRARDAILDAVMKGGGIDSV